MRKKLWTISAVMLFAVMTLSACTGTSSVRHRNTNTETSTAVNADKSTGVIRKIDKDTNNIVIYSVDDGTKTIYSYDEGTTAYTKSGKVMSFDKLSCGDIVDIECNNTNQKIKKISISSRNKVWENTKVTNFKVDESTMTMKIGQSLYSYSDSTFVFSDGEEIDISELNSEDRLIVRGYDTSVCSVVVDKGHGYVTLSGDQLFTGGYVDIGGTSGTVKEIKLFSVKVVTTDNLTVIIPNSTVLGSVIINYSRMPLRRLEILLPVSYDSDVSEVKRTVMEVVEADKRISALPAPFFRLTDYGDSALNFTLRVWTNPDDFWSVKFDLLEGILESFRKNRIEIPYNQLDIHVVNGKEGA